MAFGFLKLSGPHLEVAHRLKHIRKAKVFMDPAVHALRLTVMAFGFLKLSGPHLEVAHRLKHIRKAKVFMDPAVHALRLTVMTFGFLKLSGPHLEVATILHKICLYVIFFKTEEFNSPCNRYDSFIRCFIIIRTDTRMKFSNGVYILFFHQPVHKE